MTLMSPKCRVECQNCEHYYTEPKDGKVAHLCKQRLQCRHIGFCKLWERKKSEAS